MSTCSNCRSAVWGIQTVTFEEDLPNGNHESREFCSTECLQKYRLRHVQIQRKEMNNHSSTTLPVSPMATNASISNGGSKPGSAVIVPQSPIVTTTESVAAPSSNIMNNLSIDTKIENVEANVSSTGEFKSLEISPTSSSVRSNLTSEGPDNFSDIEHATDGKKVSSTKKAVSIKPPKIVPKHHYETFSVFEWDDYLKENGGRVAPPEAFKQNFPEIPVNEFRANMKLESKDPRNPESTSIATVVYNIGPRVCLRLDGGDNANDFYELVDSDSIQPIGTCEKNGDLLQPPLGFQKNPSQWTSFVVNALQGAEIAPDRCFKRTPPKPRKNMFEVGMKLEAVDRKHPRMILPATVGDVDKEKILVSFDGWNGAFDYKCEYWSRDIFPVGWCKKAGHPLQPPGDKAPTDKEKAKRMSKPSLMKINTGTVSPPNTGTSVSPGSRSRAAAVSASSYLPSKGAKVASNHFTNKVTNSSHNHQNGSAKVPNIKISTIDGKVTSMKSTTNVNAMGDTSKIGVTVPTSNRIPIQQSRPNLKTTARKTLTPLAGPPRNNLNAVNHSSVTSIKTQPKKVAMSREPKGRVGGDDTDTEIEESPTKQSPIPSRSFPETHSSRELVQELKPRQLTPAVPTSSLNTSTGANVNVTHKRPVQDPPKKLSEIRPTKVSRLSNSNVASTLSMSSQVKVDLDSNTSTNNQRTSNTNNNQLSPPQRTVEKISSASTAITTPSKPLSSNYNDWSIDDVVNYLIKVDETFDDPKIREKFHEHEIDGRAFVLLTFEMMKNYMELKLGPMLKILDIIAKLKKGQVIV